MLALVDENERTDEKAGVRAVRARPEALLVRSKGAMLRANIIGKGGSSSKWALLIYTYYIRRYAGFASRMKRHRRTNGKGCVVWTQRGAPVRSDWGPPIVISLQGSRRDSFADKWTLPQAMHDRARTLTTDRPRSSTTLIR